MTSSNETPSDVQPDDKREFEENPYNPESVKPEDVVRLFYQHNLPILPVVSKRGLLFGILRKEDVISELSDIERAGKLKIDAFITGLARKVTFEDLLVYGKIREFVTINLFGVVQGNWSRLQLFTAAEAPGKEARQQEEATHQKEAERQQEEQVLDWMIYLILEHIPRALYALNAEGRTIFYNSNFEKIYAAKFETEVDAGFVEKAFRDVHKNELLSGTDAAAVRFYNKPLDVYYEKIPLSSNNKQVGFLIFCNSKSEVSKGLEIPGIDIRGASLEKMLGAFERQVIVEALKDKKDLNEAARSLKITRQALLKKIKAFSIEVPK